jgi:hypothetical protein
MARDLLTVGAMHHRSAVTCTVALLLSVGGCSPTPEQEVAPSAAPMSFEEYKERFARLAPNGSWYVEEDLPIGTHEALYDYYVRLVLGGVPPDCGAGEACQPLAVKSTNGHDKLWDVHEKLALSYCMGSFSSQADADRVRSSLDNATRQWEVATDVNFIHLAHLDGPGCAPGAGGALFRVRRGTAADCDPDKGCPRARAFFPDAPAGDRELLYFDEALDAQGQEFLGITLHELGHILGLWHEHAWWKQDGADSACQDGLDASLWRGVTGADALSVMGYGFCNGMEFDNEDRQLSYGDRKGIRRLYTLPKVHGRVAGNGFAQPNTFLDADGSDDVFWFSPKQQNFTLWRSLNNSFQLDFQTIQDCPRAGESLSALQQGDEFIFDIGWETPVGCHPLPRFEDWRPFPLRWLGANFGDANLNREIFLYGQGSAVGDAFVLNRNNGIFERHDLSVDGNYYPLVGNFNGVFSSVEPTEIFWHGWGDDPDVLWQPHDMLTVKSTEITGVDLGWSQNGDALVGSFELAAAGGDEILWYSGGSCWGEVWRGDGANGFEASFFEFTVLLDGCFQYQVPLVGDFNGDNRADIFWYAPGGTKDMLWLLSSNLWELSSFAAPVTKVPKEVRGVYRPFVGDFNGDLISDIFWYASGGLSSIWLFGADGSHSIKNIAVGGDYAPIVGRFNADQCDDILWYDPILARAHKWASNCNGTFTNQQYLATPVGGYPVGYGLTR